MIRARRPDPGAAGAPPAPLPGESTGVYHSRLLELLTVKETAAWLRVAPGLVYRLIREGRLRTVRVGSVVRVLRESVLAYLDQQTAAYRPTGSRATLGQRTAARFGGDRRRAP